MSDAQEIMPVLYFIKPGTYIFDGLYSAEDSIKWFSIEGTFTVSGDFDDSSVEGTWQQRGGGAKFAFKIEITSKGLEGLLARAIAYFATLKLDGWMSRVPEGYSGLARDSLGNCASIQVHAVKPSAYIAQGLLVSGANKPASFTLTIGPFEPEMALENVVAIQNGRRA